MHSHPSCSGPFVSPSHGLVTSRRSFLGAAVAASAAALPSENVFAGGGQRLRVGIVGCGGRGTGAALQAAAADPSVRIVALGDLFADQVASTADLLARGVGPQFECPPARRFIGDQAFRAVIGSDVDLVLLAGPPHVRPRHLEAAIAAGKHVYCEKPVAVDAAGVVQAAAAAARGRAAGLSLVSGFCFRRDPAAGQLVARIHDGEIGRPLELHAHAAIGLPWRKPAQPGDAPAAWRLRNWISFAALSGGHFVEQHVEAIDRAMWILGDVPPCSVESVAAVPAGVIADAGIGDCGAGTAVRYHFADGTTLDASIDRRERCQDHRDEFVVGSAGRCDMVRGVLGGGLVAACPGGPGRHQAAMDALVQGVLSGRLVHDGRSMCHSTMVAILGRMAAEAGGAVTWEQGIAPALTPS